jgi:hypothetical protein
MKFPDAAHQKITLGASSPYRFFITDVGFFYFLSSISAHLIARMLQLVLIFDFLIFSFLYFLILLKCRYLPDLRADCRFSLPFFHVSLGQLASSSRQSASSIIFVLSPSLASRRLIHGNGHATTGLVSYLAISFQGSVSFHGFIVLYFRIDDLSSLTLIIALFRRV